MTVDLEPLKREAAEAAIEAEVRSGMVLGLGTGSTAARLMEGLARRLSDGTLSEMALALKTGVPVVGLHTWELARAGGLPLNPDPIERASTPEEAVARALRLARPHPIAPRPSFERGAEP